VDTDLQHLRTAIELTARARTNGNQPFGALLVDADGSVVLEAENTALTERDCTAHAELNLVRAASRQFDMELLRHATLYTSTEPCAMCAGAIFWAGIGRVVYALSSETLRTIVRDESGAWTLAVSCRDVFARGGRTTDVSGPLLEDEGRVVHDGYW